MNPQGFVGPMQNCNSNMVGMQGMNDNMMNNLILNNMMVNNMMALNNCMPMNNVMPMNNCMPMNNVMPFNNNNNRQNDQLGMVYGSGENLILPNQANLTNKISVVFKTTNGLITNLTIDREKTVSDLILIYLKRVDRTKLFKENSGILFLHNAQKLNIFDKTKIKDMYGSFGQIIIMVNDVKNLIGALK